MGKHWKKTSGIVIEVSNDHDYSQPPHNWTEVDPGTASEPNELAMGAGFGIALPNAPQPATQVQPSTGEGGLPDPVNLSQGNDASIPSAQGEALTPAGGDAGDGVPGSMEWHRTQLANLETREAIKEYTVTLVPDAPLNMRLGEDNLRAMALEIIMASADNGGGQ